MMDHEKIVFDQLPSSHDNGVLFENLNGTADSDKEISGRSEESGTTYVSPIEVVEISENPEERNHLTVSKADQSGTVVEVLLEDGKPVSVDTVLSDQSGTVVEVLLEDGKPVSVDTVLSQNK